MKLTPVDSIPKRRASRHNLQDFIEEYESISASMITNLT